MAEEQKDPEEGKSSQTTTVPSQTQDGETKKETESSFQVPDNLKGKTTEEIARMHHELEKKLGQQSQSISETRQQLAQYEALGKFLEANPDLYEQIETRLKKGKSSEQDDPEETKLSSQVKETRLTQENTILQDFEKDFGITGLDSDKRQKLHEKIAQELADMLDPGGKKSVREVLDSIPLPRLRNYLDKAYKLATSADTEERARLAALVEARQNREASFGTFPSSSVANKAGQLTEEERKVAKRMGISDEDYLKNKQT